MDTSRACWSRVMRLLSSVKSYNASLAFRIESRNGMCAVSGVRMRNQRNESEA
jgi:succinate dehydrogenase/fumarate reductase-like Fe-S protein